MARHPPGLEHVCLRVRASGVNRPDPHHDDRTDRLRALRRSGPKPHPSDIARTGVHDGHASSATFSASRPGAVGSATPSGR
ncbi:MAG: hypothetical protein DLM62_13565 [Pseudonocardiales bacterium]|nr:MAG: hypothetical protein DLM62_13565 [Pseudonocardiales bacterium]